MPKTKISAGLIQIGFMESELRDFDRIFRAALGFSEERGLGDLEDLANLWRRNFKTILRSHKKRGQ